MMTALTVYSKDELAVLDGLDLSIGGDENLEIGDVGMPPRLRISQPNKPIEVGGEKTEPGVIVNTITGAAAESVEIVPIMFLKRTRVAWPERYSADNDPLCVSDDGVMPTINGNRTVTDPQPGPCAECPMSQFINGEKPRCNMQRNILVYVLETDEPAILTMQKTGLKEARKLTALAKMQGIKKAIVFDTSFIENDQGSWYLPTFSRGRALKLEEILPIVEAKNELANLIIQADVEDFVESEPVVVAMEEDEIPF